MAAQNQAGEEIGMRRRRLRYRAWHRGTREMDLVLGPFADAHLEEFDAAALDRLEGVMDEEDTDLLKWVTGEAALPPRIDAGLFADIVAFRKSGSFAR